MIAFLLLKILYEGNTVSTMLHCYVHELKDHFMSVTAFYILLFAVKYVEFKGITEASKFVH